MALSAKRPSKRTKDHVAKITTQLEDMKRLNINLPAREYRAIKVYAAERDMTVTDLVRAALDAYIK